MNLFRLAMLDIRNLPKAFWIVLMATLINQIGNMAIVFLFLYLTFCGYSLSQSSFIYAIFSGAMLFAGLFGGSFVDKIGALRLMISTLILNGMTLLLFPMFQNYWLILLMSFLWGLAFGLYRPASQSFIGTLSPSGKYKITFSLYRLILNLGMSIGPALGGYLATRAFKTVFLANGIANLLASTVLILGLSSSIWLRERPSGHHRLELNLKFLKHDIALRFFILGMIPVSMVYFQHESTLAVFLQRDLNLSLSFYGLLFTLNTVMIVFLELPLNIATMNWPYRLNFMLGSFFITAGFAGLLFASEQWHILFLTLIWTIGEMVLYPSASSYIAEIAPAERRGTYMSLYSTCSNLGMLFGPLGGGILMEHFGAQGLWLACGLWGLLSILAFYFGQEPKSEQEVFSFKS